MRSDDLDAMDRALAQYSNVEPLAGIEQRVLNRVRAYGAVRRSGLARWALAVAFAAAAVLTTTAVLSHHPSAKSGAGSQPAAASQAALAAPKPAAPAEFTKRPGHYGRRPAPLSREERALLALVARAPDQARDALLDLQRRGTEPLRIEEIGIEPLRSHYVDHYANEDANDDAK